MGMAVRGWSFCDLLSVLTSAADTLSAICLLQNGILTDLINEKKILILMLSRLASSLLIYRGK